MKTKLSLSLALLLVGVQVICSSDPSSEGANSTVVAASKISSTVTTPVVVFPKANATLNSTTIASNSTQQTSQVTPTNSTQTVPMVMEGSQSPPKKSSETKKKAEPEKPQEDKSEELSESFPSKESNNKPSVVKPRKGVNMDEAINTANSAPCLNNSSSDQSEKCPNPISEELKPLTEIPPTISPPHPKHHHKPNVTADVPDQQVSAKREDYVIPVVGIIFVIPLIVILGALVYKKGVDLWERRHYRPMDFLIDGIYNNQ